MLHFTIILSIVHLFTVCLSDIIAYSEIGPMIQIGNQKQSESDATIQESILRRRLLPGGLTDSDKLTILNAHNKYRNLTSRGLTSNQPSATLMNQLVWDSGLEKVAQNYTSACIWAHNPNRNSQLKNYATSFSYVNQYVGENLFISTGSESMDTILSGIEYWYKEYEYYTYGPIGGDGVCQSGQQCGHYTQLIWGKTRYVGCGYTKCPSVKNLASFSNAIIFGCNYYFAGNYVDEYPYETGTACSDCPSDRGTCSDGLCTGCPNPSWDTYCCQYCSSTTCENAITGGLCNSPSTCTNGITSGTPTPTTSATTATKSPTSKSTTKSPTSKPTTKSPTSSTSCCSAYNSRYNTFCKSLGSTTCGSSSKCYWNYSC